ncbi:hypothetical protein AVEN_35035-1 [Araneus ventricosus]|uniref:Uncharacterized protein n=1 Tax=Araneus ventricosus TaxID=182803 RepID=A0A4Y2HZS6_ARAVE|nr:hypothetical protein AVEN_35035-1 [Araneus ventricosus]
MESHFPAILVLWMGREVYRVKYGVTGSSQAWTPDLRNRLGDHLGDETWDLKGEGIFSTSLLGEEIRLNLQDDSMWRHGLPVKTIQGMRWDHGKEYFSLAILTSRFEATRGQIGDGPRNFVLLSDDEDDTWAGIPCPNCNATPMGGRLATTYDLECNRPHTRRIFVGIGSRT